MCRATAPVGVDASEAGSVGPSLSPLSSGNSPREGLTGLEKDLKQEDDDPDQ